MSNDKSLEDIVEEPEQEVAEENLESELTEEQRLQIALEEAQVETQKYKDEYIRVHADFDNSKKRLEKEKATAVAYSNEAFARDMLGVLDSIESAIVLSEQIETGDNKDTINAIEKFKEGLQLTLEQTVNVLKRHGVEEVTHEGVFDPNFHQVLMQVDSDKHEKDEIVQIMQKGYVMKDRVIRPAMISTSK
ncbi:MAG: nucleotide exchange factor GrpE [Sulfurovum sp.]|nr:nucleotide exchange factor GrpE [Sulfurovum sp.]